MSITDILKYVLALDAVGLVISILLQNRSGGLGTVFGGMSGGEFYRSRRGLEAVLYNATIILGILFVVIALAIAVINV
ncbi:MAG: preprotein translocase subunit SecG [Candidatus Dojkabacteria bacterium]